MEAMARSIGDQGQYEDAIAWMKRALEALYKTPDSTGTASYLLCHVAAWKQKLGDHEGALETAKMFVTLNRTPKYTGQKGFANSLRSGHGKRTKPACLPWTRMCVA